VATKEIMGLENGTKTEKKKWWMGFHGDKMGSNEKLTDIDGNVQLWVFYKEKHNVMFCSLFIGLE
jgi:hypothetical protein